MSQPSQPSQTSQISRIIGQACRAADLGRFDEAVRLCRAIPEGSPQFPASRALLGSIYRQVGRHDVALPYDEHGLAAGPPDLLGEAMCRLGLAADRIGSGDLAAARADWTAAQDSVEAVAPTHWAVRWFDPWLTRAWVGAELALLADDPARAVALLESYSDRPRPSAAARSRFELAKTLLFLGVAQRCCGLDRQAADSLSTAARLSAGEGLAALLVPTIGELRRLDRELAGQWGSAVQDALGVLDRHGPPIPP